MKKLSDGQVLAIVFYLTCFLFLACILGIKTAIFAMACVICAGGIVGTVIGLMVLFEDR